jgi:hypothetical protein
MPSSKPKGKRDCASNVMRNTAPHTVVARIEKCESYEVLLVNGVEEIEIVQGSSSDDELEEETAELGLKLVIGFSTLGTMKLKGKIKEREVIILIDCGATHNFISQNVVDELEIPVVNTTHFGIVLENGVASKGKGVCRSMVLSLSKLTITDEFLPVYSAPLPKIPETVLENTFLNGLKRQLRPP